MREELPEAVHRNEDERVLKHQSKVPMRCVEMHPDLMMKEKQAYLTLAKAKNRWHVVIHMSIGFFICAVHERAILRTDPFHPHHQLPILIDF